MDVHWFANTGTDTVPVWTEITTGLRIHFTGAGSTPSLAQPVIRPQYGYSWNEEAWIGPEAFSGGLKVAFRKPSTHPQYKNTFRVRFDIDLLAAPFISAYDDETLSSWTIEMLTGTEMTNWTGLMKCFITGNSTVNVPPPTGWAKMETGVSGSMNPNALQGNSQFVTVPFIPISGGDFTFVLAVAVPSDCGYGKEGKYDPKLAVTFVHV